MAYSFKRTITCGKASNTDQSNFPLLIKFDSSNVGTTFKTAANGGHIQNTVTQSGGNAVTMPADLIFTSDSGGATKIPWEVESYDGTNGVLWVWVKIGTLTTASNATIYVFYGDAGITTQQNTGSLSPSNVWDSNYLLVMHMPDGATLNLNDSTSNANNGTNHSATAATGQIDGAAGFVAASSQYISGSGPNIASGAFTISFWAKISSGASFYVPFSIGSSGSADHAITIRNDSSSFILFSMFADDLGVSVADMAGAWHYTTLTLDGSKLQTVYLDAASQGTRTASGFFAGDTLWNIARQITSAANFFDGPIDEVRVSNTNRSADWITTEYNNQNAPLTFNTIGSETVTFMWQQLTVIEQPYAERTSIVGY